MLKQLKKFAKFQRKACEFSEKKNQKSSAFIKTCFFHKKFYVFGSFVELSVFFRSILEVSLHYMHF